MKKFCGFDLFLYIHKLLTCQLVSFLLPKSSISWEEHELSSEQVPDRRKAVAQQTRSQLRREHHWAIGQRFGTRAIEVQP